MQLQGVVAASYFWPGSQAPIKDVRPTYYMPYDRSTPYSDRIKGAMAWLQEPDSPSILTMYFEMVDSAGHNYGPDTPEVDAALVSIDDTISELLTSLEEVFPFSFVFNCHPSISCPNAIRWPRMPTLSL